ncbi:ferredoxin reductase-like C-terminal NADP-linked domain-containing protein [Armillaria luteobubalina]|uniref:NADH-cytochrome b5 reductase n=1 Tax=Armillaria luteobubalina TaxID=153913 RepID=A0AA39QQ23_9AGAR|nr:ferredoxin reductase-like C-terminal NADP-linked domain-containing protein [Armillaria luteobubalina]
MNKLQFVFLISLLLPFSVLFLVARVFSASLDRAGFHFADLILIGLPKDPLHPEMGEYSFAELRTQLSAVDLPLLGTVDLFSSTALITAAVVVGGFALMALFPKGRAKVLDPSTWQDFPLVKKTQVSPNTAVYRFSLPHPNDILGLPIGQHISISAEINGKDIMRSYTPVSSDDDRGHFELLIKSYEKGNISRHFATLKIGDTIRVKGPKGQFTYTPELIAHIGMIAGGTGITPMIQIIRAALKNPADRTVLSLIYANVNHEDILCKQELDDLQAQHPRSRFKVYYVLNNAPTTWNGGIGFVTKDHIAEHLPGPELHSKVLMCGPPPMITAMKKHLDELKYPAPRTVSKLVDQVFVF